MTDDLKARLREIARENGVDGFGRSHAILEAADRIEALEADNARLRTALDWTLSEIDGRTRYDHHEQRDNCIALARAALAGGGEC